MGKKKQFGLGYMDLGVSIILLTMGVTNGLYY